MSSRVAIILVWGAVLSLLAMGMIMVASTSVWTTEGKDYILFFRHIRFAGAGLLLAIVLSFIDYRYSKRWIWWIYGASLFLLLLCYVPVIQQVLNGERRWIAIGSVRLQPSEVAKICLIMVLAFWYARYKENVRSFWKGFVWPMAFFAATTGLIFFEKDMGTALALGLAALCVMFAAGTRLIYLVPVCLTAASGVAYMIYFNANRWNRIKSFMDLEGTKLGFGLQQYRANLALRNGGLDGVGLGQSTEKHGYLPYAHTDFIFAPLGEEFGFYGTLGVLLAFMILTLAGFFIALQTKDIFGRLLALGIVMIIFFPAMLNIAVVTASLPNSGLPLPFISYGGTNLLFTLAAIGILTSVQRWAVVEKINYDDIIQRKLARKSRELSI